VSEGPSGLDLVQKSFDELAPRELHDVLRLRVDTFVVEQACAYPELDGRDPESTHLLALEGGRLVAYARWYPKAKGDAIVLGRIVVAPEARGRELGKALVEEALARIGDRPVEIWAQARLEPYYRRLGFRTTGQPFDDWGVLHVEMKR
jgi:ElaA protein